MEYFKAANDKQLGICLRMLYANGIQAFVETTKNNKGRIEFHVGINGDRDAFELLSERYNIMIS